MKQKRPQPRNLNKRFAALNRQPFSPLDSVNNIKISRCEYRQLVEALVRLDVICKILSRQKQIGDYISVDMMLEVAGCWIVEGEAGSHA